MLLLSQVNSVKQLMPARGLEYKLDKHGCRKLIGQ